MPFSKVLRLVFAGFCALIAVVPIALAALCLANPHRPQLYLIDILTLPAFSLCAVMTMIFLGLKQRVATGLCVAALAAFCVALSPQILPRQPPAQAGVKPIRVVFGNLYIHNTHPGDFLAFVNAQHPDLIVTVENAELSRKQIMWPLEAMGYAGRCDYGETRIYTRFPLTHCRHAPLDMLQADVAAPQGTIALAAVHLAEPIPFPGQAHHRQFAKIEDELAGPDHKNMLLVGDFNSDFSAWRLQHLAGRLGLHALPAWSGSWPTTLPSFFRIPIDNAMAGDGWHLSHRAVSGDFGSDHRAIAFDLTPAR